MTAVLAVAATTVAVVAAAACYVRSAAAGRLYTERDVPSTPVGLVLGAQVYPDGAPSRFLAGRLDLARRLYERGRVDSILVSGDSRAPEGDEPGVMRDHLLAAGVPAEAIRLDRGGFDTYESCLRARDVFGVDRVTILTQTYHLPRAVGTARLLGLDALGVGDRTVQWYQDDAGRRRRSVAWRSGAIRDVVACTKTLVDLRLRHRPADRRVERERPPAGVVRPSGL